MVSLRRGVWIAVVTLIWVGVPWMGSAAQPPGGKKPQARQDTLERYGYLFDLLSPEARLQLLEKIGKAKLAFQPAVRGDVSVTIVARGSVADPKTNDLYCEVKATTKGKGSAVAGVIKWLVEDGSNVKKGDVLMVLDDSGFQEQRKDKKKDVDLALANKVKAEQDRKITQLAGEVEILTKKMDLQLAENALNKGGKNVEENDLLKGKVKLAHLQVKQAQAFAEASDTQAQAKVNAKTAVFAEEKARLAEIEEQIKKCRLTAAQDGIVVYFVPERSNRVHALIAQGEPVREGQKLLQMPDLSKLLMQIQVPEAVVFHLRTPDPKKKGSQQSAQIKVDAFPSRILKGHVQWVDTVASSGTVFSPGEKTYKTLIAIDDQPNGLKPGMSAEVQIEVGRKTNVVRVPLQSVIRVGKDHYCYVKVDQAIQKRLVKVGLRNEAVVEIQDGLKENEAVLRDPHDLFQRLKDFLNGPAQAVQKKA